MNKTLFNIPANVRRSLEADTHASANTDPQTSHRAEAEITASGQRSRNVEKVVSLISRMPGRTTLEISATSDARELGLTRHEIARRASDASPPSSCAFSSRISLTGRSPSVSRPRRGGRS